jgi:lysophospholipase L1-like esterase
MDYQRVACWGDSQTFGARTYGCYPLYLGQVLNSQTRYRWQLINHSANGYTARDLWFRIAHDLTTLRDVHQACVLIGTNDVGNGSPLDLFEEYYRQILLALQLNEIRVAYCGEIPPIWPDGHAFFPAATRCSRDQYNASVRKVVAKSEIGKLVEFEGLSADCYTDPVHFNEQGSRVVANAFANAIMSQ